MAAIITEVIPQQGFEIVLNQIATIVFDELSNQKVLTPSIEDFEVYIDRLNPYDNSEDVMINVSLANIDYAGHNLRDMQGITSYFIDIYVNGEESDSKTGDTDVRNKLLKFAGMVRYILSSGKYPYLGFNPGLIGGRYVTGIDFPKNTGNQDSEFTRVARLTYNVRIQENQEMWQAIPLLGNDTQIKIDTTDKGQKLTYNN